MANETTLTIVRRRAARRRGGGRVSTQGRLLDAMEAVDAYALAAYRAAVEATEHGWYSRPHREAVAAEMDARRRAHGAVYALVDAVRQECEGGR